MKFEINHENYEPREDFLRVATATPEVAIGDVETNVNRIHKLYVEAAEKDVSLVTFPELAITGYSIQDFVRQPQLLDDTVTGLAYLAKESAGRNTAGIVGLPLRVGNAIYNCAAVVADGEVKGIVPKQHLPNYAEFYEKRWFQTWDDRDNTQVMIGDQSVPFGRKQLFNVAGNPVGIEICEDLWVGEQPSIELTAQGATIIANPSASPETVAKAAYRSQLVGGTAARLLTGYVYVSANSSESTSDIVMSGHSIISEMGHALAENKPLASRTAHSQIHITDIDMRHIHTDRTRDTNYPNKFGYALQQTTIRSQQSDLLQQLDRHPFVPRGNNQEIADRLDSILEIQATGLARRVSGFKEPKVVLGLSGGLDSTLALLVAVQAASLLDLPASSFIHTLTMPGEASSERTQSNAKRLARSLGIANDEIPIGEISAFQLDALNHDGQQDTTYENTQARLRQAFVFNKGNQIGALALGTGDLSEIALGWCTYAGDQISGYNPNSSIPKTLVRSLVANAAAKLDAEPRTIVEDILATPISPELTGNGKDVMQDTEDLVGPYELHDFFMWHMLRWLEPERKIGYLAVKAFDGEYEPEEIYRWLNMYMERFYINIWKQQAMPDGAKVGISLSPRGDRRISPEAQRARDDIRKFKKRELERHGVLEYPGAGSV